MRKLSKLKEIYSNLGFALFILLIASIFIPRMETVFIYLAFWICFCVSFRPLIEGGIALKTGKEQIDRVFLLWKFEDKITPEYTWLIRLKGLTEVLMGLLLFLAGLFGGFILSTYNGILMLLSLLIIYQKCNHPSKRLKK